MTYSGEGQIDRLEQRPQTARKTASAPARALVTRDGLSGTTLDGKGATSREMRRSLAEQSSGTEGRSSKRQAPSKIKAGVASGSETMIASELSGHDASQSPGDASSALTCTVNANTSKPNVFTHTVGAPTLARRAKPFDGYRLADFNPIAAVGVFLCALSACVAATGFWIIGKAFVLTLIDAWSKV